MNLDECIKIEYGIPEPVQVIPLAKGHLTENSLIQTGSGKKYFLKKQRESVARNIDFIESTEVFFHKCGIPVVLPLKTLWSESHMTHDDQTYTVYPFIEDPVQFERDALDDECIQGLARMLARMHTVASQRPPPSESHAAGVRWDTAKALSKFDQIENLILSKNKADMSSFDELALKTIRIKRDFLENCMKVPSDFKVGNPILTHGDFQDQNVFFTSDGNVSHVFDFEKAEVAAPETELARAVLLVCFNHRYAEEQFRKAGIFLTSYDALNPVNIESFRAALEMHTIKAFHSTWIEGEHYLNNNSRTDVFMQGNTDTLEYMSKNFESFRARLMDFFAGI